MATTSDTALLLIGEPGAGKSALADALTHELSYSVDKKPFWHTIYYDNDGYTVGAQMGWTPEFGEAAKFPGTDRLANDVIGHAVKLMRSRPYINVLSEGDRLANSRFVDGLMQAGYKVEIAHIVCDPTIVAARRDARGDQDPVWVAGRIIKAKNLIEEYQPWVVATLDSSQLDIAGMAVELAKVSNVAHAFMEAQAQ